MCFIKVKLFVSLLCVCNPACKDHPQNDLYCVERDVKPYSVLTHLHMLQMKQRHLLAETRLFMFTIGTVKQFSFWTALKST